MKVAILGLGEAGSHFANDLVELDFEVAGWDPKLIRTLHEKVIFAQSNADAVGNADVIFNVNLSSVAESIAHEVKGFVKQGALFCEMNTSSPKEKIKIQEILKDYCKVVDVAIMAPVPGKGIRTPFLASGDDVEKFKSSFPELQNITTTNGGVGEAAKLKLLRSIVYKGVAAVICEAMEAADHFDKKDYMLQQIGSIIGESEELIHRFITGSKLHSVRRGHEMEAVVDMLESEGLSAQMSTGAVNNLLRYTNMKDS